MIEILHTVDFWNELRKNTSIKGFGKGQCENWCSDALKNTEVKEMFTIQMAELGTIQIDQYATSILIHYWLENNGFIADGTAGQFDPQFKDGYYGLLNDAPESLKVVYSKKVEV